MRGLLICSLLVVILLTVHTVQEIRELCTVEDFLQTNPQTSTIRLVHWLSRSVSIDNNGIISEFNPTKEDFGSDESKFSIECQYYTLSDSKSQTCPTAENLPNSLQINYIIASDTNVENTVRLALHNYYDRHQTYVENAYITEHNQNPSGYNLDRTFLISRDLMRALSTYETDSIEDKVSELRANISTLSTFSNCTVSESSAPKLNVVTSKKGKAVITWSGVTGKWIGSEAWVGLYLNDARDDNEYKISKAYQWVNGDETGSYETSVGINPGLNVRLFIDRHGKSVWRGPDVSESCRLNPVKVEGFDALLQLYTKDGYACARLFVKKSFYGWRAQFYLSWVGFYSPNNDNPEKPDYYEWVSKFKPDTSATNSEAYSDYDVFVSKSCYWSIVPGLHAQFFIDNKSYMQLAMTDPWPATPC